MNDLTITEYKDIRVLTTQQIAEAYETDTQVITNNFNRNKDRYTEGKHYVCLTGDDKSEFIKKNQNDFSSFTKAKGIYLWTEKGAFLHAKSLNTDTAWEVYDRLVDSYFKKEENVLEGISQELQAVIVVDRRVTKVENRIEKLENNMTITHEQIQVIKNRVNKKIVELLGGKQSGAYGDKHIRGQVYSRFNNDYCNYFRINARANTLTAKYGEALEYIDKWQPDTNLRIGIENCNAQMQMEV